MTKEDEISKTNKAFGESVEQYREPDIDERLKKWNKRTETAARIFVGLVFGFATIGVLSSIAFLVEFFN